MDGLSNIVSDDQVEHLRMEEIVHVEDHLGEQPIVRLVKRGVDEVAPGVGPDSQGQEIPGLRVDEEVGRGGRAVALRLHCRLLQVGLVAVFQSQLILMRQSQWIIKDHETHGRRGTSSRWSGAPRA